MIRRTVAPKYLARSDRPRRTLKAEQEVDAQVPSDERYVGIVWAAPCSAPRTTYEREMRDHYRVGSTYTIADRIVPAADAGGSLAGVCIRVDGGHCA